MLIGRMSPPSCEATLFILMVASVLIPHLFIGVTPAVRILERHAKKEHCVELGQRHRLMVTACSAREDHVQRQNRGEQSVGFGALLVCSQQECLSAMLGKVFNKKSA